MSDNIIDSLLNRNSEYIKLLSNVIGDYEEYEGHIHPETYMSIKKFFKEEIPEKTQKIIDKMEL